MCNPTDNSLCTDCCGSCDENNTCGACPDTCPEGGCELPEYKEVEDNGD